MLRHVAPFIALASLAAAGTGCDHIDRVDASLDDLMANYTVGLPSIVETFKNWGGRGDDGFETLKGIIQSAEIPDPMESEEFKEYAKDLVPFVAPAVFLFIVTFVFGLIMILARWCCTRCCCKPKHTTGDYSCVQKWGPLFGLNLFSAISTLLAIIAINSMGDIKGGTDDLVCTLDTMATDMATSFSGFYVKVNVMTDSIEDIIDTFEDLSKGSECGGPYPEAFYGDCVCRKNLPRCIPEGNNTTPEFPTPFNEYTPYNDFLLDDIVATLQDDFEAVHDIMQTTVCTSTDFVYATSRFAYLELRDQNFGDGFDDNIEDINTLTLENLETVLSGVETQVDITVDMQITMDTVSEDIKDASLVLETAYNFSNDDLPSSIADIQEFKDESLANWAGGTYAFFGFVFFAMVVAIACVVAYVTPCSFDDKIAHVLLHFSWFFTWGFSTVLFLMCGLIIPIAIIFSDTCTVMADVPTDIPGYFNETLNCSSYAAEYDGANPCDMFDSCFQGGPEGTYYNVLLRAYKMGEKIDKFEPEDPDMPNWEERPDGDKLGSDEFTRELGDPLRAEAAIFERDCDWGPNNGQFAVFEVSLAKYEAHLIGMETLGLDALDHLERCTDAFEDISDDVVILRGEYEIVRDSTEGCGFVKVFYDESVDALCSTVLEGIFGTVVCMFLVALCGWPQIIMSIYVSIRDFGSGQHGGDNSAVAPIDMTGVGGAKSTPLPNTI